MISSGIPFKIPLGIVYEIHPGTPPGVHRGIPLEIISCDFPAFFLDNFKKFSRNLSRFFVRLDPELLPPFLLGCFYGFL